MTGPVEERAAADLRVRRLRGDSGARGRVEGPATDRAVRADHDDRRRDDRADARAGRRARHAAVAADVEDAAGRRLRADHGRDRARPSSRSARCSRRWATTWGRRSRARAACSRSPRTATCRASSPGSARGSARRWSRSSSPPRCRWCWRRPGRSSTMAQASAVSRLVVYVATCAAALRLRSPRFAGVVARTDDARAVRAGDSDRGDPDRARDPVRRHADSSCAPAASRWRGRRPVRHRRSSREKTMKLRSTHAAAAAS